MLKALKVFTTSSLGRVALDASGRIWLGLLSFALLPVYMKFIGPESFGVMSAFASIQAIIGLFDFSLAPSLSREISKVRSSGEGWGRIRDLTYTMEIIYFFLAAVAGVSFYLLVPTIAHFWLKPEQLSSQDISKALSVAALALAIQWPASLYSGGLIGLQRQRLLTTMNVISATARAAITLFCLWFFSGTLLMIFSLSVGFGLVQISLMRFLFWNSLPESSNGKKFDLKPLKDIWRFSASITLITISSVLLLQADKIVLSNFMRLEDFGFYTISLSIAGGLFIISGSLFSVLFPKFSELANSNKMEELKAFYHLSCQGIAAAIFPIGAVISLYSHQVLMFWTKNPKIADAGSTTLSVFILGNVANCILSIPTTVLLGFGITRIAVISNLASLAIAFILILSTFKILGPLSGPITWTVVNLGLVVVIATFVNLKVLKGELKKWLFTDTLKPLFISFASVAILKYFVPQSDDRLILFIILFVLWFVSAILTLLSVPNLRVRLLSNWLSRIHL